MADQLKCERCRRPSPHLSQSYTDGKWECDPCALKDKGAPKAILKRIADRLEGKGVASGKTTGSHRRHARGAA